ncbi:MAG: hypothetical protein AAF141_08305 [Pseudomonadota bacterium]
MLMKLAKACAVLAITAAFIPGESIGSMPGLSSDAPEQFAVYGARAVATVGAEVNSTCAARAELCDQIKSTTSAARATVTGSVGSAMDVGVASDPIARQIALETAKATLSSL